MSRRSLVVGVECGRGKTLALLADGAGTILARREGVYAGTVTAGVESIARAVFSVVEKACGDGRCSPSELDAVVIGLGFEGRLADRPRFADAIGACWMKAGGKPPSLSVETGARITLEGAFDRGPGVVILAGTGSSVVGKTPRGDVVSVGGWGRILGDEGSGYYIGREALVAVAHESDRLGNAGALGAVFAQKYHWKSRDEIIAAVYQESFDIASLAPVVLETAARNDTAAQRIVDRAATQLADQARVVVMQMGIRRKVGLVMAGGLLGQQSIYADALHMKLLRLLPQVEIRSALHEPAHGAVLMALEKLKKV